jgi:diacylglycerol kinase family enzyme
LRGCFTGRQKEMKVTLIHNPDAGRDNQPSSEELVRLIRAAGHSVIYQSSKHAEWERVLDEHADLVALSGGDGLVGLVTKRLVGKRIPLTILPMGTANNIAATFDLKGRPFDQLIAGWNRARRVKFDVGIATGPWGSRYFIEGLGAGAFTETMSRLDARSNVDLAHYGQPDKKLHSALQILQIRLAGSPAIRLKLALDGRDLTGEYVLLEAMNIRSIGPNLRLAPEADPGDGHLDLVLVADNEREKLQKCFSEQRPGKGAPSELTTHRGRRLHMESDEIRIHIDDDVWPSRGEHPPYAPMIIDASLYSESLEILLPR